MSTADNKPFGILHPNSIILHTIAWEDAGVRDIRRDSIFRFT